MNTTRMDQADCANVSSLFFNETHLLLLQLPDETSCLFWRIVHNKFILHISVVLVLMLFLFAMVVNIYLLLGLEHSEALSWQPRYMLLKNLIVSDLLQTLTLAPSLLYCLLGHKTLTLGSWCLAQYFTLSLAIITSLLTVASMALERFVYTCHGIHYLAIMTNLRMCIFVASIWLLAVTGASTSTLLALMGRTEYDHVISGLVCEPEVILSQIQEPMYFENFNKAFIGLLVFFCLLVFSFSYGRMYQEARQAQEPFQQDSIRAQSTVAFYLGIFFLQLFPSIIKLITLFGMDIDSHLLLSVLVMVPPCVNPLAYGIRNKEVRQALKCLSGLR